MLQQFALWLALSSTLIYVAQLVLATLGGHHGDFGLDTDGNVDAIEPSFQHLTMQSLVAFGLGFGWLAFALLRQTQLQTHTVIVLSAANGVAMVFLTGYLLRQAHRLSTTSRRTSPKIGALAKTYTTLPAARGGRGLVQVFDSETGQARQFAGLTDAAASIPAHVDVVVVGLQHDTVIVKPID